MPEAFERCVASGGKVRTKSLSGGRYRHICIKGGKLYRGEIKKKKRAGKKFAKAMRES